jgi:hypothetical protein
MIRDIASFTAMAAFITVLGFVLPDLAAAIHGKQSAIVAASERN